MCEGESVATGGVRPAPHATGRLTSRNPATKRLESVEAAGHGTRRSQGGMWWPGMKAFFRKYWIFVALAVVILLIQFPWGDVFPFLVQ